MDSLNRKRKASAYDLYLQWSHGILAMDSRFARAFPRGPAGPFNGAMAF